MPKFNSFANVLLESIIALYFNVPLKSVYKNYTSP